MNKIGYLSKNNSLLWLLAIVVFQISGLSDNRNHNSETSNEPGPASVVRLIMQRKQVVMSNGIVTVTLSSPGGSVLGIQYNGIENILSTSDNKNHRGYWDVAVTNSNGRPRQKRLSGTEVRIITQTIDQAEVSFVRKWDNQSAFPVNVDKRYIMLRGSSGFYSYGIFERLQGWPELTIAELRMVFRLQDSMFRYMVLSDKRQRIMPTLADHERGTKLDYPEAVRLTNTSNTALNGEVDDKYQYSSNNKDSRVYGWISNNWTTGFWMITPSNEFRIGGPLKQDLTSHYDAITLSMFVSEHYAGQSKALHFIEGEPWKKVFGPIFVYLNSGAASQNRQELWQDAKAQMRTETQKWPYSFPLSNDFPKSEERGSLRGQLQVFDQYINKSPSPAAFAYVGLAPPGEVGSWQLENKGYQFWTQTNSTGSFIIKGIRAGNYNLFAWIPGHIGDYKYDASITITSGCYITLNPVVFKPPRNGPTLWEIGTPDRTAAEFYVPDPDPNFVNHLYLKFDKFRQYGLWKRYTDLYPDKDLVYTVGVSDHTRDWFYAHVTRSIGSGEYTATTWQIIFQLDNIMNTKDYTLRLALASATNAELLVGVNNDSMNPPNLRTGKIGDDNAIARHGIHGLYHLYEVKILGSQLINGQNTIFLKQPMCSGQFNGIMYDYIRLEGPST